MKKLILLASVAAAVGGCNCGGTAPAVESFGALPGVIPPGGTAVLSWTVKDADSISIDNNVGLVTGTVIAVSPTVTTTYTLTATNKNGTTTAPATVTVDVTKPPLGMAGFKVVPATNTPVSGAATSFTVTAVDASGATVTYYPGTVHFTLTDPSAQAAAPADYTFTAADQGTHTVSVTLVTAGSVQLIAQDTLNGGLAGQATVTVGHSPATQCALSGVPSTTQAGAAAAVRLTMLDASGNVATRFTGTVSLSSSDPRVNVPSGVTFGPSDRGTVSFTASFGTLGPQTVSAAASSITCTSSAAEVSPGPAASLQLSGAPSSATAGATSAFTVTAYDAYGNVATSYGATFGLSTTDPNGSFPAGGAASNGVANPSVRLVTAGSQQVVVADPGNPSLSAQFLVAVGPANASACTAAGVPATARAGDALPVTVTLFDAFGNVATGYTGTLAFSSGDGKASLPASFAYSAPDQGTHGFSVRFGTPGSQAVTATDAANSITCASSAVAVSNGPAVAFQLSGVPSSTIAGTTTAFTVTALDAYGNAAADFSGTPALASTDTGATFPVNGAFSNGVASASVRLVTAGARQVTATDPANAALAAQALVSVGPADASTCTATGIPAAARAGDPLPLEVTLLDAFGNVATGYTGTMTFTSGDTRATLPADYAFAAADRGARGFSVRFGTPGSQSVTVSDTGAFISCTSDATTLNPGKASTFAIGAMPGAAVAGAEVAFQVTAQDSYGNVAGDYTGPVTLTSTDPAAFFPTTGSFTGGVASFGVVFQTIGGQSVTATDSAAGFNQRGGAVAVHGLVYTPAAGNAQTLRLVMDPASTPAQVTLRLVAQGSATGYSAGFNIPADATRASLVSITRGDALDPGSAPAAMAASLAGTGPMANMLSAGISQKATDTTADAAIAAGQVVYTVVLKPSSTSPGVIFDGSQGFRAAVRDFEGNELLSQADFAVGKLELQ